MDLNDLLAKLKNNNQNNKDDDSVSYRDEVDNSAFKDENNISFLLNNNNPVVQEDSLLFKDKISIILNMRDRVDKMIITGGMAFTFLKARDNNFNIGDSLYDSEGASQVNQILNKAKEKNVELILPQDFICNKDINGKKEDNIYCDNYVKDGYKGIDVGDKSIELFDKVIYSSNTIFLN